MAPPAGEDLQRSGEGCSGDGCSHRTPSIMWITRQAGCSGCTRTVHGTIPEPSAAPAQACEAPHPGGAGGVGGGELVSEFFAALGDRWRLTATQGSGSPPPSSRSPRPAWGGGHERRPDFRVTAPPVRGRPITGASRYQRSEVTGPAGSIRDACCRKRPLGPPGRGGRRDPGSGIAPPSPRARLHDAGRHLTTSESGYRIAPGNRDFHRTGHLRHRRSRPRPAGRSADGCPAGVPKGLDEPPVVDLSECHYLARMTAVS